ncbi:FAD/NAD(P)-binding protein [Paracraurococcus lichenis]|uniref:FAD-dependent oxidoreductase n=1 Tax=Paracraurococcus lichenis TaxID=3064888 RepID=A0ABT9E9M2_9PROT|nr:FAD-dependent oxidoreductase [Paracraurococcus sp. LOR1-02]MDO9712864.1 FAD-dependent oxidoreductase [Paracraurococcus sp. LOR1-02]
MPRPTIAIVGAGFSGTLLALHLLRRCPEAIRVTLIERNSAFGRGQAYATGNPSHLLNVPAARMSAFHDQPNDFVDWLRRQPDAEALLAQGFVPRRLFGAYVRALLSEEVKRPENDGRLELLRGDVAGLSKTEAGLTLAMDGDRWLPADLAVLAIGNFPPEPPPCADADFLDGPLYLPDPWAADSFAALPPEAPVLLIGTGLTMVDATISLLDQGHRGPIHALSRRGLLPRRHAATAPRPAPVAALPATLVELVRSLRGEARRAAAGGGDWRPVVDRLRPFTQDVWQALSPADQSRFLRHLRPWWDVHRHRMAGPVADRIEAARASGQLRLHVGRIQTLRQEGGIAELTYRRRGDGETVELRVARVVNCAGPGCDYDRIDHPLVRSLLQAGLVRPDPLRLGLDVTGTCALRDRSGAISRRLFAVGPVTKGSFWEMTAVPDIRRQCEVVAEHLAGIVRATLA